MGKFSKYKKHYNSEWEKQAEFKCWLGQTPKELLTQGKGEAFCKWCATALRPHKADLLKHAKTAIHNANMKLFNTRSIKKITETGLINFNPKKEADLKVAVHIVCHSAINTVDHLTELLKDLGKGSRLENIQIHRTKCSKLVLNVIAPSFLKELLQDIGDTEYSIILDESTETSFKYMAYCVRYFSEKQKDIIVDYLGFSEVTEATAEKLYENFMRFIDSVGLKIEKLIGLGTDGASNLCGDNHSLFTLLKEKVPHLQLIKCVCHSLNLCACKANEELPSHLEYLLRETRNWFNHSPLRQFVYRELFKLINHGVDPPKLSKLCATRWLAWALPVSSTTKQWVELGTHFNMAAQANKSEKCYTARILADMYADNCNLLYFLFLNEILLDLTDISNAFQKTKADITKLYSDLRILIMSLVKRFIKPSYLRCETYYNALNVDSEGMLHQNDIDLIRKALEKARLDHNNDFNNSLLPLESIDFGKAFKDYATKKKFSSESFKIVQERCVMYLKRLCNELMQRIPRNLKVITNLRYFSPNLILENTLSCNYFEYLPWELAAKNCNKVLIHIQWRKLCTLRLQDVSPELYLEHLENTNKSINAIKFWVAVRQLSNATGDQNYKDIADFALRALSLPISNAVVERVFSIMTVVKTKLRNKMSFDMLVAIMRIRIHLKVINQCCSNFKPTKSMLALFNSNMYVIDKVNINGKEEEYAFMEALNIIPNE